MAQMGLAHGCALVAPRELSPVDAPGALAIVLRDSLGTARALKLEALNESGLQARDAKGKRWRRRNFGATAKLRFTACNLPEGRVHICEGEVSALALAVQCMARGRGMAVGAGGVSGLQPAVATDALRRPVAIHADRDRAGRKAARKLAAALRAEGRAVTCEALTARPFHSPDCDALACDGCAPCPRVGPAGPACKHGPGCLG